MSRYLSKYIYGRYEIYDSYNDQCICYCYRQEDSICIAEAMNNQHEVDSKIKEG